MSKNVKQQVDEQIHRSLMVSDEAKRYLSWESWTPIMGALLLSGIRPSSRWTDIPALEGHQEHEPVSQSELFRSLLSTMRKTEYGLDKEVLTPQSLRFKNAENILALWDAVCQALNDYPTEIAPKDFSVWLWRRAAEGDVHLPEPMWARVFVDHYTLKEPDWFVPRAALALHKADLMKARKLIPKHVFGEYIARAWADGATSVDEILASLAEMMKNGDINGVKFKRYALKSDLVYTQDGEERTLNRDSFARQLRRMKGKSEASDNPPLPPVSAPDEMPFIRRIVVDPAAFSRFSSGEQFLELAVDLLLEAMQYVRLATHVRDSDGGWDRDHVVVAGNVARLWKLLRSIAVLSRVELPETVFLTAHLAIETIVDIKYLIANFNPELIEDYVNAPTQRTSVSKNGWSALDLPQKAKAIGFEHVEIFDVERATQHVHGSWLDLCALHINETDDGCYYMQRDGQTPHPRMLLVAGRHALAATRDFLLFASDTAWAKQLLKSVEDLVGRLQTADALLDKHLSTQR